MPFADDVKMFKLINSFENAELLQTKLNNIYDGYNSNEITFSINKCSKINTLWKYI